MSIRGRVRTFVLGGAVGAALAYFFDPDRGRGRRATTRDQVLGSVRRTGAKAERAARAVQAEAYGARQRLDHPGEETPAEDYDDATLARKVESELFAPADFPKGSIVVNVVHRVVEIRGEAPTPDDIKAIERRVRAVHGVSDVRNLLHLPKTPAPNKAEARRAS